MPPDALCVKRRPGAYSRPAAGAPYTVRGVMRLKKLLFLTWSVSYGYGTEKSLADVLNRFDPKQYEISVLPMFKYAESTIFRDHIRILDALVDYTAEDFCEEKALARYYELLGDPLRFNRLIREKYDCVIACNHNAPSYFASYLKGGAKALWIRGDMRELDYRSPPESSQEYRRVKQEHEMQANVLKSFDRIAVISDVVQESLRELFGVTKGVVKISNSVDAEKIRRLSEERVKLPDKKLFVTLGRLDYNKNQLLLLKAAKELRRRRSDFMVCLLGDGDDRAKLEAYIRENGLEDAVKILGFLENPYPYVKNSVGTVLTSLSEGFSLVLVESVMLGTPIISTDVGVARELVENYGCGELVPYDEKALAQVLLRYLDKYDGKKPSYDLGGAYELKAEVEQTVRLIDEAIAEREGNAKLKKLPYPETTIREDELDSLEIPADRSFILRVLRGGVPYEYLIHRKSGSEKLIVFHNGAVPEGRVRYPVFQRHSWIPMLKTSSVFCMDPTLYLNSYLQLGWGIGKNQDYYLENSSRILGRIVEKMGIRPADTAIYGSSGGGYLAAITGIFLRGAAVVADNAQLDVRNWIYKDALDAAVAFCFDNIGEALRYRERFSLIDTFEKNGYVPPLTLHVNLCSRADNSTQLIPFLQAAERMRCVQEYHDVQVQLHYHPDRGHDGLTMEEALASLYRVLGVDAPCA